MAYYSFAAAILAGEAIHVFNEGKLERDLTYMDDAVAGILAALDHAPNPRKRHRSYNLGNNKPEQILRLIEVIERALGRKAVLRFEPMQRGDVKVTAADIDDSQRDLVFKRGISIDNGLPLFVKWHKRYRNNTIWSSNLAASLEKQPYNFEHPGFCPVCEQSVIFRAATPVFRSSMRCDGCGTSPPQRALFQNLLTYFPNWRGLRIHECSPGWDTISRRLAKECINYSPTHYDRNIPFGTIKKTRLPCGIYRSENLESQTFADGCFDLVIMQEVFEHVFFPDRAIAEISRTLAPGGAVLMTVPILLGTKPSRRRAALQNGQIVHLLPAEYHGNPIDETGSLVTVDWGYDIVSYFHKHSGLAIQLLKTQNADLGILGELTDVIIGIKSEVPNI